MQAQSGRLATVRGYVAETSRLANLAAIANRQIDLQDPVLASQAPGFWHDASRAWTSASLTRQALGAEARMEAGKAENRDDE